jgi:hypothetical protein
MSGSTPDPRPDLGDVVVGDGELENSGVDHLHQIVLLQNLVHLFDLDRSVALFSQAVTERTQATDKAAAADRIDGASSKVGQALQTCDSLAGDHDLGHIGKIGIGKGYALLPFGGHSQTGGDNVSPALDQGRQQPIEGDRYEDQLCFELPAGDTPVEECLVAVHELGFEPQSLTRTDEVVGGTVAHQHPNGAPLLDPGQITGPGLENGADQGIACQTLLGAGLGCRGGPRGAREVRRVGVAASEQECGQRQDQSKRWFAHHFLLLFLRQLLLSTMSSREM